MPSRLLAFFTCFFFILSYKKFSITSWIADIHLHEKHATHI